MTSTRASDLTGPLMRDLKRAKVKPLLARL